MNPSPRVQELLASMSIDEKVDLVTGLDMWHTRPIERLNIASLKVTDGPNGARGDGLLGSGTPTACIPSGSALGATWDPDLVERLAALLGDEAKAKGAQVLLAPTMNLHRSPKGGRNFECYSEDPFLSARLATSFIRGVQSRGVATTAKHFAANDSEYERNTINSQVDERTLREVYLLPFEHAVKFGKTWGIMSAYNRLNGDFCSENEWLLTTVLRKEWGFDGFVVSDWFATRSAEASANSGLSLEMPGPGIWYGDNLRVAVQSGNVSEEALDRIATDVLRLCERCGALDQPSNHAESILDREEDRVLIREAAAAATVLIRNNGVLPLRTAGISSLAVIGPNALNAKIMGGGSAKVAAYRTLSPYDALRQRLGSEIEVHYARGCDIHRSTPTLTRPLLQGDAEVDYFAGYECAGEPLAHVVSDDFGFLTFGAPQPGVPAEAYSFRARGTLMPSVSGIHEIRLTQAGRARVCLNGDVTIDAREGDQGRGEQFFGFASAEICAQVTLEKDVPCEITVEFSNRDTAILSGMNLGVVSMETEDLLSEACELATRCDVAIVVVGTNDDWETEGRDRDLFELPGGQPELVRAIAACNPRTIAVVNAGSAHALDWLEAPAATLQIGFAGQELGEALVDVLLGDADPGGRMPTTIPARYQHFAAYLNYPGENGVVRYGEGVYVGHRWHDAMAIAPTVPFGHGMSYTTFSIAQPRLSTSITVGQSLDIEIDVTNTGTRPGYEVVQVYVEPISPRLQRPLRELKGFAKVQLEAGSTTTAKVTLDARSFAYYDVADPGHDTLRGSLPVPADSGHIRRHLPGWYVDPGHYRIALGRSSADLLHSAEVELRGDSQRLPD